MGLPRGSVQGSLKKSSFALLFFPLSQCKMLVWTLGSSLLSVFPEIVSERSWEQGRVGAGVAFPSKLLPLLQPHWSWRNGILFMPGRLNPYLHISILWAIKLLFDLFSAPPKLCFYSVLWVFWGVSHSGLGNVLDLFVVQRRAGGCEMRSFRQKLTMSAFAVCKHMPPPGLSTQREKITANQMNKNPSSFRSHEFVPGLWEQWDTVLFLSISINKLCSQFPLLGYSFLCVLLRDEHKSAVLTFNFFFL